jgi:hypothetical protein
MSSSSLQVSNARTHMHAPLSLAASRPSLPPPPQPQRCVPRVPAETGNVTAVAAIQRLLPTLIAAETADATAAPTDAPTEPEPQTPLPATSASASATPPPAARRAAEREPREPAATSGSARAPDAADAGAVRVGSTAAPAVPPEPAALAPPAPPLLSSSAIISKPAPAADMRAGSSRGARQRPAGQGARPDAADAAAAAAVESTRRGAAGGERRLLLYEADGADGAERELSDEELTDKEAVRFAEQTLQVFVPLAHRLGMWYAHCELPTPPSVAPLLICARLCSHHPCSTRLCSHHPCSPMTVWQVLQIGARAALLRPHAAARVRCPLGPTRERAAHTRRDALLGGAAAACCAAR